VLEIFPKLALKNKSIANQVWARGKLQLWNLGVGLLFFPRLLIRWGILRDRRET